MPVSQLSCWPVYMFLDTAAASCPHFCFHGMKTVSLWLRKQLKFFKCCRMTDRGDISMQVRFALGPPMCHDTCSHKMSVWYQSWVSEWKLRPSVYKSEEEDMVQGVGSPHLFPRAVVSVPRLPFQFVFPVQFSIGSHLIRRLFLVLSPNVDTFLSPTYAQIASGIPPFWCYLSTLKNLQEDISNSTVFPHSKEGF